MSAATPEIEALEAEETEEEKMTDELAAALEASRKTEEEDEETDEGRKEAPEEVVKDEPPEDPSRKPEERTEEVPKKEEEKPPEPDLSRENRELRQILREQKREMATMQAKLARVEKGVAETLEEDEKEPQKLSRVEELEQTISVIGQQRGPIFATLIEAMEMNPKYEDIREVCSRDNFDDIFEELSKSISAKENRNQMEVQLELEAEVWAMDNPYKFMYGIIKDYHPRYAKEEKAEPASPSKEEKKKAEPEKKKEVKEPPEAPTSIASVGGSDADTKSGWTAKRIDELPEDELENVPDGVYQKYLRGELD